MPWVTRIPKPVQPMAFSDEKIRFIWCTDVHVGNDDTDSQVMALELAVDDCNAIKPHALICTGDVAGNRLYQTYRWFNHTWRCQRPVYLAIGNHDESELSPGSLGSPATDELELEYAFNRSTPFYCSVELESGDGSTKALCIFIDSNFYDDDPDAPPPGDSANHEPGDRIGISATGGDDDPAGGYWRQIGTAQLAWIEETLAASDADFVLLFMHYSPSVGANYTDKALLADKFQADGRPTIGFCGHIHGNATSYTLSSTDGLADYTIYKCPALLESGSWTRVTLSFSGGAIVVDELEIQNYTNPDGWTINAPFTLAA